MKEIYVSPEVELFRLTAMEPLASTTDIENVPNSGGTITDPFDSNTLGEGEGVVVVPIPGNK